MRLSAGRSWLRRFVRISPKNKTVRYPEFRVSYRTVFLRVVVLMLTLTAIVFAAVSPGSQWRALIVAAVRAGMASNLPKAEELFQQAVQVTSQFPPGDPRIGTTYNSLGLIYREEKKYPEAEKAFDKALELLEKVYGPDSLDAGNVNFNISSVQLAMGHYDAALPYILKTRSVYQKLLGEDSLKTANCLCMLGEAYRNMKRFTEAEIPLKTCADAREVAGGVQNAELADALYNLGLVYEHEGKFALADPTLKLAEKIRELTIGVTSPEFAEALEAHAALLKQMGRDKESERDDTMAAAIRRHLKN
jgi:tetratricopeptide (TPR) repeat protein